jgi:hypothetical protein
VIVTRGNVDLSRVLDSLIFDDVIIWNNAEQDRDQMTWGRALAIDSCKHDVIYSQDDDIVHSADSQYRIIEAYQPGVLTGCMWREWSDGARAQGIADGYDDLVFPGSGAVYDAELPFAGAGAYLEHHPLDDFFRLWADTIIGIIADTRQLDIRFEALPHADAGDRMCDLPDAIALKTRAIMRARAVRDAVTA